MPKVSIVIPIYNVERYIRDCLDSVCNQTLRDIEIICVDDGSTDNSGRILDEYAAKDSRFHIIHKENEGYGRAMNVGMAAAASPYVGIVESDDMIVPYMYERLYGLMEEKRVDVIKSDFYVFYTNHEGEVIEEYRPLMENPKYEDLYGRVLDAYSCEDVFCFEKRTWSGIYRTDFLRRENILHNETPGASYQDNGFWFQTMVKAKSVYFVRQAFYRYRIDNPNSSIYNKEKVYAICNEYDFVRNILDKMGAKGTPFYKWASMIRIRDCIGNIAQMSEENKKILAKRTKEEFIAAMNVGEVDGNLYDDYWKVKVFDILADPEEYIRKENQKLEKMLKITRNFDSIILYGAGKIGQKALCRLKEGKENTKIQYFAVTELEGNRTEVSGIPVKKINDLHDYKERALVVISVGKKCIDEVEQNLRKLGFRHFVLYSDLIQRGE